MTWRRLRVLLAHLPRDSSYVRAVLGDQVRWSDSEHLLAGVIDAVRSAGWYSAVAASDRRLTSVPDAPKPIPRPGDAADPGTIRTGRSYTLTELAQVRARWADQETVETTIREVT